MKIPFSWAGVPISGAPPGGAPPGRPGMSVRRLERGESEGAALIYIDLRIFAMQQHGGVSVVWTEYVRRLQRLREGDELVFCVPSRLNELGRDLGLEDSRCVAVGSRGKLTKYLPYALRGRKKDILHMSYYGVYPLFRGTKIVTLHDFTHEKFARGLKKFSHGLLKYHCLQQADVILCVSESTRRDLLSIYPNLREKRIYVTPNAVSERFLRDDHHCLVYEDYYLWVGKRDGYKNFSAALRFIRSVTDAGVPVRLLVVGGGPFTRGEHELIERLGLGEQLTLLLDVSESQLAALYTRAIALLYLSRYEGFGLPILEAQASGCPVVCWDVPTSHEIGGDSVVISASASQSALRAHASVVDGTTRSNLIERGVANAARFQWGDTVRRLLAIYRASSAAG